MPWGFYYIKYRIQTECSHLPAVTENEPKKYGTERYRIRMKPCGYMSDFVHNICIQFWETHFLILTPAKFDTYNIVSSKDIGFTCFLWDF